MNEGFHTQHADETWWNSCVLATWYLSVFHWSLELCSTFQYSACYELKPPMFRGYQVGGRFGFTCFKVLGWTASQLPSGTVKHCNGKLCVNICFSWDNHLLKMEDVLLCLIARGNVLGRSPAARSGMLGVCAPRCLIQKPWETTCCDILFMYMSNRSLKHALHADTCSLLYTSLGHMVLCITYTGFNLSAHHQ